MNTRAGLAPLALLLVLAVLAPMLVYAQAYYDENLTVSRYWKFEVIDDVNSFKQLMLNTTSDTISAASSTYVSFTVDSGRLKITDLAVDNILPVLGLPTYDHIYVLKGVEGDLYLKVLNYNSTDGTFTELAGIHISPYADEVVIAPLTSKGIVIVYLGAMKFEFNVTGWNLIAIEPASENTTVYIDEVVEAEVPPESLSAPFSGTEVSGSDSRVIEITGSGTLRVWFWEAHSGGDMDFAVFYGTNAHYADVNAHVPVDTYAEYTWIISYRDDRVYADYSPAEKTYDLGQLGGKVKIVTYPFYGDTSNLGQWKVVYSLSGGSSSPSPTPTPTNPPPTNRPSGPISIGSDTAKWILIGVGVIVILGVAFAMLGRR